MKLKERINYLFSEEIWEGDSTRIFVLLFVFLPLIAFFLLMLVMLVERRVSLSDIRLAIALLIIIIIS
jgi:hypothetical protein